MTYEEHQIQNIHNNKQQLNSLVDSLTETSNELDWGNNEVDRCLSYLLEAQKALNDVVTHEE